MEKICILLLILTACAGCQQENNPSAKRPAENNAAGTQAGTQQPAGVSSAHAENPKSLQQTGNVPATAHTSLQSISDKGVTHLNDSTYSSFLNHNRLAIVDFWAAWCGPCRMLAPEYEAAAKELDGKIAFGKLNVDEHREIAGRYNIRGIPCLIVFREGKEIGRIVGFRKRDALQQEIEKYL